MKPKYTPCINCGAVEYKNTNEGIECEYCGTVYENENKKEYRNERGDVTHTTNGGKFLNSGDMLKILCEQKPFLHYGTANRFSQSKPKDRRWFWK